MLEEEEQLEAAGLARERQMLEKVTRGRPGGQRGPALPPRGSGSVDRPASSALSGAPCVYGAYLWGTLARAPNDAAGRVVLASRVAPSLLGEPFALLG